MTKNTRRFLIRYSFLFALCCLVSFFWYWFNNRTFIWIHDGFGQHYQTLIFYGEYLRGLFSGKGCDSWSYFIGEGGDILQNFHYYCIGEPLTLLSVFFNKDNMYILYSILSIVRLYLAGLSFAYFCKVSGNKDDEKSTNSLVAGAITYAFCFWAIYNSARHVFFVTPMIYLPLVLAGVEKIIHKKKPVLLSIAVFLAAISNFYFFYVIVLLTVIYVAIRLVFLYGKHVKECVTPLLTIFVSSLIGVMTAGVVFLPSLDAFTGDVRMGGTIFHLFYPLTYYKSLPAMFLTPTMDFWLCLDLVIPAVLAVAVLFASDKNHDNGKKQAETISKVLFIIGVVIILIPFLGQLFNGMSYMANKWSFAFSMVVAYIVVLKWDDIARVKNSFLKKILVGSIVVVALSLALAESRAPRFFATVVIYVFTILILMYLNHRNYSKYNAGFLMIVLVISIANNSFWLNSYAGDNYAAECRRPSEIEFDNKANEAAIVKGVEDQRDFYYRYSGEELVRNGGLNESVSTIMYHYTLTNPGVSRFHRDMGMMSYHDHEYENYDARTFLTTLSSVKYYVVSEDSNNVPYGFSYKTSYEGQNVYQNEYPIGLCFTTDKVIDECTWEKLSTVSKQEAFLYGVYLDEIDASQELGADVIDVNALKNTSIPYTITCENSSVKWDESTKTITVDGENAIVTLAFEGLGDSENYVDINGLRYLDGSDTPIIFLGSNNNMRILEFYEDGYQYYSDKRDFEINLGYEEEPLTFVRIGFVSSGTYTYDNISVTCQPMEGYVDKVEELTSEKPYDVHKDGDVISCKLDLSEDKIAVFTIPFSKGWTAYVDGVPSKLYRADLKYMALDLTSGSHDIRLCYETPLLKEGIVVSIAGVICFVAMCFVTRKKDN